ncbi:MAG: inositol monophosphatase [Bdellovibrionota bacterium]
MNKIKENLPAIADLVTEAAGISLAYWNSGDPKVSITKKPDGSDVTEVDLKMDAVLREGLQNLFPDEVIITEETFDPAVKATSAWIVDPLDGTTSFLEGNDDFAILLAYIKDHQPIFGLMCFPAQDLSIACFRDEGIGGVQDLKLSQSELLEPNSVYTSRFEPVPSQKLYQEKPHSGKALLEFFRGNLDGIILKDFGIWDHAPAALIAESLGGCVTNGAGQPYVYLKEGGSDNIICFSNGKDACHLELLTLIPEDLIN